MRHGTYIISSPQRFLCHCVGMLEDGHVVIVGGSLAGLRAAQSLRREGHAGPVTIISDEAHWPPYDRPPLSKQILVGSLEPERARLRVPDDLGLEVRTEVRAVGLDVPGRRVALGDGTMLAYDALVVATGASPRTIPGAGDHWGVHVLRTIDDCMALRFDLGDAERVAIVGAGFIGCEVASSCRTLGLDVTVIDLLPHPLAPLGPRAGQAIRALHEANGVSFRLGTGVAGFEGDSDVRGVRLDDGGTVEADVVVIGIGVAPNTGWLEASDLQIRDGVVCDRWCRALGGDDRVVAVGDVARWDHPEGDSMRIEHWTNAGEQAAHAAKVLVSGPDVAGPYAPVPYFWSDQYGTKIQFVGRTEATDEFEIVEGSLDDHRWVAAYGRSGSTVGALCVGWPARLAPWQQIVAEARPFPPQVP